MSSLIDLNRYKRKQRDRGVMRLDVSSNKRLFGREDELKILRDVQTKVILDQKLQICWVHGLSGSGKTSLCHAALSLEKSEHQPYDLTDKMFYIEGKYDQLYSSTTAPYSAIISAFDMLGKQIKEQNQYKEQMKKCLEFEGTILTKLIPSFQSYATLELDNDNEDSSTLLAATDNQDDVNTDALMLASERLAVAFRSFLRKFTSYVRPLSIFLDDVQWSDRYSQELIAAILHDDELNNFLFVAAFRDDDPELTRSFRQSMEDLTSSDVVTDLPLKDLDMGSINQFLASVLSAEPESTQPLAQVVHRKTNGNPYFVIQLLEQLYSQECLRYNFASIQWEWDIESASTGTDVSDNVADVVTSRLKGIPPRVQRILKLAACLGFFVDVDILKRLDLGLGKFCSQEGMDDVLSASRAQESGQDSQSDEDGTGTGIEKKEMKENFETQLFESALKRAETEALVERAGTVVKFSHDRIQQCVYESIELGRARDVLHYQIGTYLKQCLEATSESKDSGRFLFLAVDQLNRGSRLVHDEETRVSLIKLNFEASQLAKQKAGIESVASFLRKAIELVQPSFWLYYYELILEIYCASAEVDFSLGMLDEAKVTIQAIMENAVRKIDTVRALVVEYQMYGIRCQYKEAIAHGCRILQLLGEPVPRKVSLLHIAMEYFKARRASKNKSDEFFTKLRPTESTNTRTILKILQVGSVFGWNADVNFAALAFLRAMRITVRDGSSEATPYIYSGYGFMLGLFGDYEEAFRFGKLALKTRRGKETFPSACTLTYGNLNHLQLPLSAALEPYLSAYRVGLETGDLFFGTICISCYALIHVTCGLPLGPFADDMRNFGSQLRICHQDVPLAFILPTYQLALNLMGKSDDPFDLSRDAIKRNQDLFVENILLSEEGSRTVDASVLYLWYLQLYNAYVLEDTQTMKETLKRILGLKKEARRFGGTHMMNYFLPFMDGVVGLCLANTKPKSKTGLRAAKAAIAELTQVSKTRPVNSITLLKLLKAEVAARKASTTAQGARKEYDEAIKEFSRSGLNHFSAIANELAGRCMFEKNDTFWGEYFLGKALTKWDEYNALVKVKQMLEKYPFLKSVSKEIKRGLRQSSNIQGRARFDANMDSLHTNAPNGEGRGSGTFESATFAGVVESRNSGSFE